MLVYFYGYLNKLMNLYLIQLVFREVIIEYYYLELLQVMLLLYYIWF